MVRRLQDHGVGSSGLPSKPDAALRRPGSWNWRANAVESRERVEMMGSIQLALSDTVKAEALRTVLARSARVPVRCVEKPEPESACAVVVDPAHLGRLGVPLNHPERVVLVTRGDEQSLREAWDLGVGSVVNEQDPVNTVVLAILAVCLRAGPNEGRPAVPEPEAPPVRREEGA